MTEKVIFEFRAEGGGDGVRFSLACGEGIMAAMGPLPIAGSCPVAVVGVPRAAWRGRARDAVKGSRRHMREALDFFEQMYRDLYGKAPGPSAEGE